MKAYKTILAALFSGLLLIGLAACDKGPAEKTGEAIDDAASNVTESTEEAAEALKEKMDK